MEENRQICLLYTSETVPVDGIITSGQTSINQAVMTGESLPVDKGVGDQVSSGTVNQFGAFDMRATRVGQDLSRIHIYQVDRRLLKLEITESIGDVERRSLEEISREIVGDGYCLSLDDFGAQYSNLSILSSLQLSELKIDKSIINDLYSNQNTRILVEHLIHICRQLGIDSVAEGVEEREQLQILEDIGCTCLLYTSGQHQGQQRGKGASHGRLTPSGPDSGGPPGQWRRRSGRTGPSGPRGDRSPQRCSGRPQPPWAPGRCGPPPRRPPQRVRRPAGAPRR